ncbi:MAG TPA: FG-GAP-like repeat-containing protein [Chitinophagaceae bacterium]|nr:FG-GAP-like repeat-containing protein [Chitinophagaceae bacterium]
MNKKTLSLCVFLGTCLLASSQKSYVLTPIPGLPATLAPSNARILTGDFDNDGDKDILYQNSNTSGVEIHYLQKNPGFYTKIDANASGQFTSGPFFGITFTKILDPDRATTGQPFGQRVFDYDADGDVDIFEISTTASSARLLTNNGGAFSVGTLDADFPTSLTSSVSRWVTADFDSDGDQDILYQNGNATGVGINSLRNDIAGSWTPFAAVSGAFSSGPISGATFSRVGNTTDALQLVFNADGTSANDIYQVTGLGVSYYRRVGSSFVSSPVPSGLPSSLTPTYYRIVPGDFDNDTDVDFLLQTSNTSNTNIVYLRNNRTTGTFSQVNSTSGNFNGTTAPFGNFAFDFISRAGINREQIIMDVDGDGDLDILQLSTTLATSVLLQTGSFLPIKLESFNVLKRGAQVEVSWKTSQEINVDYFTVEYSLDGLNFKSIQQVGHKGSAARGADYAYMHPTPVKGIQYYRLVEYDIDGSETIFPIKSIRFDGLTKPVEIYPNEVIDRVTAYFNAGEFTRVQLIDQVGRVLESRTIGNRDLQISVPMRRYTPGIYYLKFIGQQNFTTERILKR